jgi:hypothetical protein
MNLEQVLAVAASNKTNSVNLEKLFAKSVATTNEVETQRLRAKTQLLEVRQKTYSAIRQSQEEQEKKGGVLDKILGTLGLAGLAKGLKGAKPPTGGAGVVSPKPKPGGPRIGRGVAGLNVLFGGIDFMQRRSAGQSNLQAGIGAGAGVAGGMAGAALGAKIGAGLGTIVAPGLGTLIGGGLGTLVGGGIGAMAAGNVADRATGVDAGEQEVERRVQEEEKKTSLLITKTPFSGALDAFDSALDKLASFPGGICACAGREAPPEMMPTQRRKDQLQKAYEEGYNKGVGEGRKQGGVAGFIAGAIVVGGIVYLDQRFTGGRAGKLIRIGKLTDLVQKTPPKPAPAPSAPRTPINPRQVRIEEPQLPQTPTVEPPPIVRPATKIIKKSRQPQPNIETNVPGGTKGLTDYQRDVLNAPGSARPASSPTLQQSVEQYKNLLDDVFKKPSGGGPARQISEPTPPPVGPQSSVGGSNIIALAEPNTTIVPVPVGGGTQIISGGGATPYQAAAKYAQMMSQITA